MRTHWNMSTVAAINQSIKNSNKLKITEKKMG